MTSATRRPAVAGPKAILERRAPPTFDILVEIQSFAQVSRTATWPKRWTRSSVATTFRPRSATSTPKATSASPRRPLVGNAALANRSTSETGGHHPHRAPPLSGASSPSASPDSASPRPCARRILRRIVDHLDDADAVITLRPYYRQTANTARRRVTRHPHLCRQEQHRRSARAVAPLDAPREGWRSRRRALEEAEEAIGRVINEDSARD